jgi:hypothetical protein
MAIISGCKKPEPVQVKGHNGAGAIPLPGASVGSAVFGCVNIQSAVNELTNFESTISVAGQIQQTSSSNLATNEYWVYVIG